MPCQPVQINIPEGPSGPAIPGLGIPFALRTPDLKRNLSNFPENLLELFSKIEFILPPGALRPQLSRNFGKDPFDALMKLMDQFMPFLMLYKFFLPVLNLILCIIEVLCSIPNPIKVSRALIKLFRQCIPQFLNIFPLFAFIIMFISLLLLLLTFIEFLVQQAVRLALLVIKQIKMLSKSFDFADEKAMIAIAKKIGAVLCYFQQLMVLMAVFTSIFQTIKEMLSVIFSIPPCDSNSDCCTTDVCPAIVKSEYTRNTATFSYFNKVVKETAVPGLSNTFLSETLREESWQIYDSQQETLQAFINIVNAADIPVTPGKPKPIFFPTDANYNADTSPIQAAYTVDLRLFYKPLDWGRTGAARYVRIKDCVVLSTPKNYFINYDNSGIPVTNGVLSLAGGTAYEDDGMTIIPGFDKGLNSFLHKNTEVSFNPVLLPTDGYNFLNIEYTFKPNQDTLLSKNLITSGCLSELAKNKDFINTVIAGDIGLKLALVNSIALPDTAAAETCIINAADQLASNVTEEGAAEFQSTVLLCLDKLKSETLGAIKEFIKTGFDPCKSTFTISPRLQFTTQPIKINVILKDSNGLNLASNIPTDLAAELALKIKAHVTIGEVAEFIYDGAEAFVAEWTSKDQGNGEVMISFENQIFCTNNIPDDLAQDPSRDLQQLQCQFVYVPSGAAGSEGDSSEGIVPRRDEIAERASEGNNYNSGEGV